jgi:GMP synthase-like glutamine amidotransferase
MVPVALTYEGTVDPVFSQGPSMFQVFQWHGEGISLPPEIPSLLASANFSVQAFRVRERCYGLLFHPEIEEVGMQALCHECPEDVLKGGISPKIIHTQTIPHLPILHELADRLIGHLAQ